MGEDLIWTNGELQDEKQLDLPQREIYLQSKTWVVDKMEPECLKYKFP